MHTHMEKPKPQDCINLLNRQDQCTIFQLRTGHTKLNYHLNRFNPQHAPLCRNCSHPYETTSHVLFDCQATKELRRKTCLKRDFCHGVNEKNLVLQVFNILPPKFFWEDFRSFQNFLHLGLRR